MKLRISIEKISLEVELAEGDSIALPFGRTPISTDERPRLANSCNVLGKILGNPKLLATVKSGDKIKVAKA